MNNSLPVVYQLGCAGVDWFALKQALLEDDFDNGRTPEQLRQSCEASAVNVFARLNGRVIGTVRVLSDGVCNAYMVDVWTLTAYRKRGVARRMVELALEQLPGQHVYLFTDSAEEFYHKLGFTPQGVGLGLVVGDWLQGRPGTAGGGGLAAAVAIAASASSPYMRETPLHYSLLLSETTGANVHLKLENLQYTGSFKLRGAMNKLLNLSPAQRHAGIVAASSGNHGAAVAYGCRLLGATGIVFVPEHASPAKIAAMRRYGVNVRTFGDDSLHSEQIGPFIASGEGVEVARQLPRVIS